MDKENPFLNSRKWRAGRALSYRTLVVHGLLRGLTTTQDREVLMRFQYEWKHNPLLAITRLKAKYRGLDI